MRLIQLEGPMGRRAGVVENGQIVLLKRSSSVFALATAALEAAISLEEQVSSDLSNEHLDYDALPTKRSTGS